MRLIIGLLLLSSQVLIASQAGYYSGRKTGWFWYEKTKKPKEISVFKNIPKTLSPEQWQTEVQKRIERANINLRRHRDVKSAKAVLKINKEIMDNVEEVRGVYAYTQQMHPELDPRVETPNHETGWNFFNNARTLKENKTIYRLTKRYGLIFFFNGGEPMSEFMCRVVASFGELHRFFILPVAVNGKVSKVYPLATKDEAVFNKLKLDKKIVKAPAIVAYDQETDTSIPIMSGFASVSDIRRNILRLAELKRWK